MVDAHCFIDDIFRLTGLRPSIYDVTGDKGRVFTVNIPVILQKHLPLSKVYLLEKELFRRQACQIF